ncbi:MAG: DUF1549 domain-containing protein, partial [Akkermansiaceae bacterium]|nr:DUF1549 domain-containing protein [Akkermansiaceae bacterium]
MPVPEPPLPLVLCLPAVLLLGLPGTAATPSFEVAVQPILERNCVRCHKAGKVKGGLRMDTREKFFEGGESADAVVPGNLEKSELIVRTHLRPIDEGFMPDEGQALSHADLATLSAWVKGGAPWPDGVTLTERKPDAVKRVAMPEKTPANLAEAAAMLDDLVRRGNADEAVITTDVIGDAAFLRRATVDLIGRIPTMQEVREFESWGDDRRAKLIETLCAHPRFADRWTVFMADLLRIRSNITGGNQLLAYVHASLEDGKPYDILVRELISASGAANANPAVGYILGDGADPLELAAATSQIFLGVRIGCAMCHDHPFDDWEQRDFYDLAAFFGKTQQVRGRGRNTVYTTEGDEMRVLWPPEDQAEAAARKPVSPRFPFLLADFPETPPHLARFERRRKAREDAAVAGSEEASIDALLDAVEPAVGRPSDPVLAEARKDSRDLGVLNDIYRASELRTQLAGLITDPRNRYFARAFVNRLWAELTGHGFVEPLDNFSDYTGIRHASALDFLAHEFVASGYDLRSLITMITLSDTYRRGHLTGDVGSAVRDHSEKQFAAAPVRRMLGEVLYDSIVVAGHLTDFKWPANANLREVKRQIQVPTGKMVPADPDPVPADGTAMMAAAPAPKRADGYDLESSLGLDFNALLEKDAREELEAMRQVSDEQIMA